MLLTLLSPPGGPDLAALAGGFCKTAAAGAQPNLAWLASLLVMAGVVLQRRGGKRK